MAGMKFEYDESGGKFYYFVFSFYALILIPLSYYFWPRSEKKKDYVHPEEKSNDAPCRKKYQLLNANEPKKRMRRKILKVFFIIGWMIFLFLAYKVALVEVEQKEYDPFEILGIDRGTSQAEIKKAYRKLSLTHHPDKGGNPEVFTRITKAYQALTDEEIKKNWEEYGNPDGPGVMRFGIALPSWIVDEKHSIWVLVAYGIAFMVILPLVVGTWWYRSIKFGTDQVLMETTRTFYALISNYPSMEPRRCLMVLSRSLEFSRFYNTEIIERESDNILMPQLMKELPHMNEKSKDKIFAPPFCVKARALMHAQLGRVELPDTLEHDKNMILLKTPSLINEMISIAAQVMFSHSQRQMFRESLSRRPPTLKTIENMMKLSPMIVQGLWDRKSPLLQLPHISEDQLRHFVTKKRSIRSIREFVSMKEDERRMLMRNLTDEQYYDIMEVCACLPLLDMEVKVGVIDVVESKDQDVVPAGSVVTVRVTLTRRPMREAFETESPAQLELEDRGGDEKAEASGGEDGNDGKTAANKQKKPKPWEKQKKKKAPAAKNKKKKTQVKSSVIIKTVANLSSAQSETNEAGEPAQPPKEGLQHKRESVDSSVADDDQSENGGKDQDQDSDSDEHQDNQDQESAPSDDALASGSKQVDSSPEKDVEGDRIFREFQEQQRRKDKLEPKEKMSHRVFCPYYPAIKQEYWWLYITDRKQQDLHSMPNFICSLKTEEKIELKFQAPLKPSVYNYKVWLRSDSYFDCDQCKEFKITVTEAEEPETHSQSEHSDDDDEDDDEGTKKGAGETDSDDYDSESGSEHDEED